MAESFHRRYLTLVEEIERTLAVARWKSGDLEIWPRARMDLYLDMYWAHVGHGPPVERPKLLRAMGRLAMPLRNLWASRHDLTHRVARARPAHTVLLGDGVSLDCVDGAWQDRYGEPLIEALEKRGLETFLMQGGSLARLPWHRPTFAANAIEAKGLLAARASPPTALPDHERVLELLAKHDVDAPSLRRERLERLASVVLATATAFEHVLSVVKPKLALVVSYYAGLGAPFLLACRRQGILSIDLQHCPQGSAHKAYSWWSLPVSGYATLPAVFWNWTAKDANHIRSWTDQLAVPWHRSHDGGHTQFAHLLDEPHAVAWQEKYAIAARGARFEREILVALQPIGGQRDVWNALAKQIDAAPATWRWWIRRHPAADPSQDAEYAPLLALRRTNVLIDEALSLPLPVLLQHMSGVVSLASGAAAEAAMLGVPALFLSDDARGTFGGLIERGLARVVELHELHDAISHLSTVATGERARAPDFDRSLGQLEALADEYSRMCRTGDTAAATHPREARARVRHGTDASRSPT
jgi:hypothetical protein